MRLAGLAVLGLLVAACAHHDDSAGALAKEIEGRLALPKGASPVWGYRRHYAFSAKDGDRVEAVYVRGGRPASLWLDERDLPVVLDGGCSVVTFSYRVKARQFGEVRCN